MKFTLSQDKGYQEIVNSPYWKIGDGFIRRTRIDRSCFVVPTGSRPASFEALFCEDEDGAWLYIVRDGFVYPGKQAASLDFISAQYYGGVYKDYGPISEASALEVAFMAARMTNSKGDRVFDQDQACELLGPHFKLLRDTIYTNILSSWIYRWLTDGTRRIRVGKKELNTKPLVDGSKERATAIKAVSWSLHAALNGRLFKGENNGK